MPWTTLAVSLTCSKVLIPPENASVLFLPLRRRQWKSLLTLLTLLGSCGHPLLLLGLTPSLSARKIRHLIPSFTTKAWTTSSYPLFCIWSTPRCWDQSLVLWKHTFGRLRIREGGEWEKNAFHNLFCVLCNAFCSQLCLKLRFFSWERKWFLLLLWKTLISSPDDEMHLQHVHTVQNYLRSCGLCEHVSNYKLKVRLK